MRSGRGKERGPGRAAQAPYVEPPFPASATSGNARRISPHCVAAPGSTHQAALPSKRNERQRLTCRARSHQEGPRFSRPKVPCTASVTAHLSGPLQGPAQTSRPLSGSSTCWPTPPQGSILQGLPRLRAGTWIYHNVPPLAQPAGSPVARPMCHILKTIDSRGRAVWHVCGTHATSHCH